jgi:hypothetical protein
MFRDGPRDNGKCMTSDGDSNSSQADCLSLLGTLLGEKSALHRFPGRLPPRSCSINEYAYNVGSLCETQISEEINYSGEHHG